MRYQPPKFKTLDEMASIDVGRLTEGQARSILEGIRWPNGIGCPHCGSVNVKRIKAKSMKVRDGVIQCNDCKGQFTVTVGTVMHGSHITLRQWVQAFYSMNSHKKGVSALQLQRNLGLHSYHSAWFLAHRIRLAMKQDPLASKLKGTVEVDECYIGGKPRNNCWRLPDEKLPERRGRATLKTPVLALVERDGRVLSEPILTVDGNTLKSAIREQVDKSSTIMTDENSCYDGIGKDFEGGHQAVKHKIHEWTYHGASTNQAESYFALLKRGIHGTFHHVSKKHLHRYCDEFDFRWDFRKVNDGERTTQAIRGMEGKRLLYHPKQLSLSLRQA
jgi:transposase-like protein